jgi:hypothetical protein
MEIVAFAVEGEPFASADEAWIWAVQGMRSRLDGANVKPGMAEIIRPCEASDIFAAANDLRRSGQIRQGELQVMLLYGGHAAAPAMLGRAHRAAVPYWQRGMDALGHALEQKGIIAAGGKRGRDDR